MSGYKPKRMEKATLEEMAGVEIVRAPGGRAWRIRIYNLGGIWRFHALLAGAVLNPCRRTLVKFFQSVLMDPEPGLGTRLRRACGLPDYSRREVSRAVSVVDARFLRDAAVKANLDMEFEDYLAAGAEAIKKKTAPGEVPGLTGEKSRGRCSSVTG